MESWEVLPIVIRIYRPTTWSFKDFGQNMPMLPQFYCFLFKYNQLMVQFCGHNVNTVLHILQYVQDTISRRHRFWHATHDCVTPYVDIILHRGRF